MGGEILLDDVSVTATPEPSALLLTGPCLAAMVLRRAVRKPNKSEIIARPSPVEVLCALSRHC